MFEDIINRKDEFMEKQRLKAETKRQSEILQIRLDAQSLVQEAKEAQEEIQLLDQMEKNRAKVQELKDLRHSKRPLTAFDKLSIGAGRFLDGMEDFAQKHEEAQKEYGDKDFGL